MSSNSRSLVIPMSGYARLEVNLRIHHNFFIASHCIRTAYRNEAGPGEWANNILISPGYPYSKLSICSSEWASFENRSSWCPSC